LEIGIVMDLTVAQSLVTWLNERIKVAEQMRQDSNAHGESELKK
jgi:hypothetical protein